MFKPDSRICIHAVGIIELDLHCMLSLSKKERKKERDKKNSEDIL